MVRLIDPKYYKSKTHEDLTEYEIEKLSLTNLISALTLMIERGHKFIVGGRSCKSSGGESVFETLDTIISKHPHSIVLRPYINDLFVQLDESQFRIDLSSTDIRNALKIQ